MKKKRFRSALCAAALILGLSAPALAYSDVAEGRWYSANIQKVTAMGLMTGVSADRFAPAATVTRGTAITVLWRLEGSPAPKTAVSFPDLSEGNWAYAAAAWAKEMGIASGYSGGNFGSGDSVTREQLATFLYRYALYKKSEIARGVTDLYQDAPFISRWALTGMQHALGSGLMTGTSASTLSPLGLATRAELASILVRLTTPVEG